MANLGSYLRKGWPVLLLVAAMIIAFYINLSLTADLEKRISTGEGELALMKSRIASSQEIVDEYVRIGRDLSRYSDYLFTKQNPQELIEGLRSDASNYDISLNDIQIDIPGFIEERESSNVVIPLKFQAAFTGDYYQLGRFLKMLEERPYLEQISVMNVGLHLPDGSRLRLSIKGTFRVFDKNIVDWCEEYGN